MGVTEHGLAAIVKTRGNKDVHVILRGGTSGPNFSAAHIQKTIEIISKKREFPSIMVDCSRQYFHFARYSICTQCTQMETRKKITGISRLCSIAYASNFGQVKSISQES